MMLFAKDAREACRRVQTSWIVTFYRVIAFSSYRWSFEVLTFLWAFFRALTLLLTQYTSSFSGKLKFTQVYILFQKCFLTWITTSGADYQNKKGQFRVKKSKTTLVLEIRSLRQRTFYKWRNNYGFYRSKEKSFQSLVSEISSDMINDVGKLWISIGNCSFLAFPSMTFLELKNSLSRMMDIA